VLDEANRTFTLNRPAGNRFFRVFADKPTRVIRRRTAAKTLARQPGRRLQFRQVLECAAPAALFPRAHRREGRTPAPQERVSGQTTTALIRNSALRTPRSWLRGAGCTQGFGFVVALLCVSGELKAAEKAFTLSGANLTLEDVSAGVEVRFRSLRLNRAQNVWNVEALLTNKSSRLLRGPFVLSVESFTGTTGPVQPDGLDNGIPAKAFFDFSAGVADGVLAPGAITPQRTLTLGVSAGAPALVTKVFAAPDRGNVALGLVRPLDEAGQPLANVQIEEVGPVGPTNLTTDPVFGVATVGQGRGTHIWKFSAPGYLPVWHTKAGSLCRPTPDSSSECAA